MPRTCSRMQVQTFGHQFDDLPSAPGIGHSRETPLLRASARCGTTGSGRGAGRVHELLPLSDDPPVVGLYGAQFEDEDPQTGHNVFRYAVSPDYCQTMGIHLLSGRCLDERDTTSAPQAALISESLAKSHFASPEPYRQASPRRPQRPALVYHRRVSWAT